MKQRKAAGTRRELQVLRAYQAEGWLAFRAPASLGVADIVAMRKRYQVGSLLAANVLLIECKANHGSPYMNFRAEARQALRAAARAAGATALLVHWAPGKPRRDFYESEWPASEAA